jgi:hypothetical protein
MYKTRIQSTEVRVGDKTCYGPPDLVPVHPLGDAVYDGMDEGTTYIIETEDGTVYKWFIALYVPENKYENNVRKCVSRTEDGCTTWWEEPCDINEMVYRKPFGITAQYKSDGSIIMKYSKGKAAGQTLYYSAKNKLVNAVEGLQSVSRGFGDYNTVQYPTPNYKMMDYKFMVFEKHDLYESGLSPADEAVYNFVKISLHYVAQKHGEFESDGERTVRFTDRSGRKNAKMVLMVGVFTKEMIDAIREGLKEPYKPVDDGMFVCAKCMGPVTPWDPSRPDLSRVCYSCD